MSLLLGTSDSRWKPGDQVRHRMSGWAGEVINVRPDGGAEVEVHADYLKVLA